MHLVYLVLVLLLRQGSQALLRRIEYTGGFRNSALGVYLVLDGKENKVDISIVGTNGKFFLVNVHGVLRRMGATTEIPGRVKRLSTRETLFWIKMYIFRYRTV